MGSQIDVVAGDRAERRVGAGTETIGLLGNPPLFVAKHRPSDAGAGRAVIVCSPVYAEFMQNYGREIRLARRLSAGGTAVARFHYRGAGDSSGDPARMTIDTMVADALEVAVELQAEARVEGVDVVGTRLGGHVAAEVASQLPGSRLVVWEPVIDMARYFDEVFRARRMVGVVANDDSMSTTAGMIEHLESAGVLDVVGYNLHLELYRSALATPILNPGADSALLVQASRTAKIKRGVQALAAAFGESGGQADIAVVPPGEGWWIHDYDEDASPTAGAQAEELLLAATVDWLHGPADGDANSASISSPGAGAAGAGQGESVS